MTAANSNQGTDIWSTPRWRACTALWVLLVAGACTAFVGLFDLIDTNSAIGSNLRIGGAAMFAVGLIGVIATRPGAPGAGRKLAAVATGVSGPLIFLLFIAWRIGVSGELREECMASDNEACVELASRKVRRGKHEEAIELYRRACDNSSAQGCVGLASMLQRGQGTEMDEAAAFQIFQRSCTLGSTLGCSSTARALRDGIGVEADETRALAAFSRACELGHAASCANVRMSQGEP